jgi:hypothetical protein
VSKEELIKELESLIVCGGQVTYYCWLNGELLTAVYYVTPEEDGKIPCPNLNCPFSNELKCGRRLIANTSESFDDQAFNRAIRRVVVEIRSKYKIPE